MNEIKYYDIRFSLLGKATIEESETGQWIRRSEIDRLKEEIHQLKREIENLESDISMFEFLEQARTDYNRNYLATREYEKRKSRNIDPLPKSDIKWQETIQKALSNDILSPE